MKRLRAVAKRDLPEHLFDAKWFDSNWYSQQYGIESSQAQTHFEQIGENNGWDPNPVFDTDWYRQRYPDVPQAGAGSAYTHFLAVGRHELRCPNPRFSPRWYLSAHLDLAMAGVEPFEHFLFLGRQEGRFPTPTDQWATPYLTAVAAAQEPAPDPPKVTIVIPVYGHWDATERCLRALAETEAKNDADVLVVDDASPDDTVLNLRRYPWVQVLRNDENLGYLRSTNRGVASATTEHVLLLNNDTEPLPGFLTALTDAVTRDPKIALVGSRLVYADGYTQEAGSIIWADGTGYNYGKRTGLWDSDNAFPRDVDYCSAASLLVDREFFMGLGGFDEIYAPAYYEDTDLAFQSRAAGRRVVYEPRSVVIHHEGVSHGTDVAQGMKSFQARNLTIFKSRWSRELRSQPAVGEVPFAVSRSRGWRPIVLFVREAVITPDHDSGSLRTKRMIQVLQDLGYQVAFFSADSDPLSKSGLELQAHGVQLITDLATLELFLDNASWWLVAAVYCHVDAAVRWRSTLSAIRPECRTVFDTVDIHHLRESAEADLFQDDLLGKVRARATELRERREMLETDVTLVVSPTERDYLSRFAPTARVEIVSNIHELSVGTKPWHERSGLVFVGSFAHSPNLDGITWFLTEVWPLLDQPIRDAGIDVLGGPEQPSLRALASDSIRVHGWVPQTTPYISSARLSVAPLRFGAGVKGKVGEAWSAGLPVAGTDVALEGMTDSEAFCASSARPDDMAELVNRLYGDPELWEQARSQGLDIVESLLSTDAARRTWARILDDLAGPRDEDEIAAELIAGRLTPASLPSRSVHPQ